MPSRKHGGDIIKTTSDSTNNSNGARTQLSKREKDLKSALWSVYTNHGGNVKPNTVWGVTRQLYLDNLTKNSFIVEYNQNVFNIYMDSTFKALQLVETEPENMENGSKLDDEETWITQRAKSALRTGNANNFVKVKVINGKIEFIDEYDKNISKGGARKTRKGSYESMNKADLMARAVKRGIQVPKSIKKSDLIAKLRK